MTVYEKVNFNFTQIIITTLVLAAFIIITYFHMQTITQLNENNMKLRIKQDSIELESKRLEEISMMKDYKKLKKYSEKVSGVKIPETFSYKELSLVHSESKKYNLDVGMILRLIQAESSFKPTAISSVGAQGYMQIMPKTYNSMAKKLKIKKKNTYSNIKIGIYYINYLYKMFTEYNKKDRMRLTILSYNYGPGRVKGNIDKFLGPDFDTYPYLNKILRT
jgi:hypothetical protein